MAATVTLADLSRIIVNVKEDTKQIKEDVSAIRGALDENSNIVQTMLAMKNTLEDIKKNTGSLGNLKKNSKVNTTKNVDKSISKGTESILKSLMDISKKLDKIFSKIQNNSKGKIERERNFSRKKGEDKDRDFQKKKDTLSGLSKSIELIERLRNIKLKDFLGAKIKIKHLSKLTNFARNMFKKFKSQKEIEQTMGFVKASVEMVKELATISKNGGKAKKGAKIIQEILFGKKNRGGLLEAFRKISKEIATIKKAQAGIGMIKKACGGMLLVAASLTGIAVLAPAALIGSLAMAGILVILTKTFKAMDKSMPYLVKGTLAILQLGIGILAFSAGIMIMKKTVKNLTLKDVGIMAGSILALGLAVSVLGMGSLAENIIFGSLAMTAVGGGLLLYALGIKTMGKATKDMTLKSIGIMAASVLTIGLAVAALGLGPVPVFLALGSATLLLMGSSLGIFALSLRAWDKFDPTNAMGHISTAVEGIRDAFGLELGKNKDGKKVGARLGKGIMGMAMGFLEFGGTFFTMGTLLVTGITLGLLKMCFKTWDNYDASKAIKNLSSAVNGLKSSLGINEKQTEGMNGKGKLKALSNGLLDTIMTFFSFGKTFFNMGSILLICWTAKLVKSSLEEWAGADGETVNAGISNIQSAITNLKSAFGLDDRGSKGLVGKISGAAGDIVGLASSILQMGSTFAKMGTLLFGVGIMDLIKLALKPWSGDDLETPIANIKSALGGLTDAFGLEDRKDKNLFGKIGGALGDIVGLASSILQMGSTFSKMGTILMGVGMMDIIKKCLAPWDGYDGSGAITNMQNTLDSLMSVLGLHNTAKEHREAEQATSAGGKVLAWGKGLVKSLGNIVSSAVETVENLSESGSTFTKLKEISKGLSIASIIQTLLKVWDAYKADDAINNLKGAVNSLSTLFSDDTKKIDLEDVKNFGKVAYEFKSAIGDFNEGVKMSGEISKNLNTLSSSLSRWVRIGRPAASNVYTSIRLIDMAFEKMKYTPFALKSKAMSNMFKTMSKSKISKEFSSIPIKDTVDAVNTIDMAKATIMVDMFKSFAKLKDRKPFDTFKSAVDRFVDACSDLADTFSNIETGNSTSSNQNQEQNQTSQNNQQSSQNAPSQVTGGVSISNTKELADKIAQALRTMSVRLDPSSLDINLIAEGGIGKTVRLTIQD